MTDPGEGSRGGEAGQAPSSRSRVGALAVVLMLLGGGLLVWGAYGDEPPTAAAPPVQVQQSPAAQPRPVEPQQTVKPPRVPTTPHPAAGTPLRVQVPQLQIDVPVLRIPVVDGVLNPPPDPQTLGWWQDGAPPGAVKGGALITGHTVSSGGGALDDLEQLSSGDPVTVDTDKGRIQYVVNDVEIYHKASLARHSATLFSQESPGRLVLITCEDWNGQEYLSNVVVVAYPKAAPSA